MDRWTDTSSAPLRPHPRNIKALHENWGLQYEYHYNGALITTLSAKVDLEVDD